MNKIYNLIFEKNITEEETIYYIKVVLPNPEENSEKLQIHSDHYFINDALDAINELKKRFLVNLVAFRIHFVLRGEKYNDYKVLSCSEYLFDKLSDKDRLNKLKNQNENFGNLVDKLELKLDYLPF